MNRAFFKHLLQEKTLRKLGDSNPRYEKFVRQFSKLLVSATHPNFLGFVNLTTSVFQMRCKGSAFISQRQTFHQLFSHKCMKNANMTYKCNFRRVRITLEPVRTARRWNPAEGMMCMVYLVKVIEYLITPPSEPRRVWVMVRVLPFTSETVSDVPSSRAVSPIDKKNSSLHPSLSKLHN